MQIPNLMIDRIEVKPPYYALEKFNVLDADTVEARVPIEQRENDESSFISGAEIGRHLAILGSCALSLKVPQQQTHFYLAYRADFQLVKYKKKANESWSFLIGRATSLAVDRRTGEAMTSLLTPDGEVLYTLKVHYHILAKSIFERLFARNAYRAPLRISQDECATSHRNPFYFIQFYNPYEKLPMLFNERIEGNTLTCSLGKIQPEKCLGHFWGFPAMPVAILMSALIKASGELMKFRVMEKDLTYYVVKALVEAENLAFVGDVVNLEAKLIAQKGKVFQFECRADNERGEKIGHLDIDLKSD